MACPILAAAHALTGKPEFLEDCDPPALHTKDLSTQSGLYRHSPQDEAAWGRGNGFQHLE